MIWIDLVTLLATLQFLGLMVLVGRARGLYGVYAPATSGHPVFERYFRVQQNTLETLIMFLPALWVAAHYFDARWMAAIGVVYLIGRVVYLIAYLREPKTRALGYLLSALPVAALIAFGLIGIVRALLTE